MQRRLTYSSLADIIKRLSEIKDREKRIEELNGVNKFDLLVSLDKEKEPLYEEILPIFKNLRRDWVRGIITKELYTVTLKPLLQYQMENKGLVMPIEIEIEFKKLFPRPEIFRSRVDCPFIN